MEHSMLDMKVRADRRELAEQTGIALAVLDEYRPKLMELPQLNNYAEDCAVCDTDGAVVEVQWYGRTQGSEQDASGQCCRACVGKALTLEDVDPYQPVEIEYLPLVARNGAWQ